MWSSTRSIGKTLNQPSLETIFNFWGINSCCVWDKFILGTSEQTAQISKTGFAKIEHTAVSKSHCIRFSSTKTDYDKFESWKILFSISLPGLFSPEPPKRIAVANCDTIFISHCSNFHLKDTLFGVASFDFFNIAIITLNMNIVIWNGIYLSYVLLD